jgi:hypothetical protein
MTLDELSKGTYVGLNVSQTSLEDLAEHCRANKIKARSSLLKAGLHTTVLYSRKRCPGLKVNPTVNHVATFSSYDLFDSDKGNKALVVKLNAPSVVTRHLQLMAEHQATYDFPVYLPHITLNYNYSGSIDGLAPFNFPIVLTGEYVEDLDLDLNWGT